LAISVDLRHLVDSKTKNQLSHKNWHHLPLKLTWNGIVILSYLIYFCKILSKTQAWEIYGNSVVGPCLAQQNQWQRQARLLYCTPLCSL